ncbi:MAG: sterol desaturase family protein [Rhizobiales bacterium]|nr:sterol desaturase family protein [Hyphomicrobiales bacterium]
MHDFLNGLLHIRDVDQIGILLALIVVDVVLTWVLRKKYYAATDSLNSVLMALAYAATIALSAGTVLLALYWVHARAFFDIDWAGSVWLILAAYVIVDFAFYWYHRAIHEMRFGWAAHVVHHSSQYFNVGTALRSSFVEAWLEPLMLVPVVLLGIDPVMAIALMSINHLYQYWLHTQHIGKLGPMEWIMNTPSHHRVHHGSDLKYCDRNYAGTFIIWDRLFGSFQVEEEKPVYGIRHQLETVNPLRVAFHEWIAIAKDLRSARCFGEVMGYLFAPPGWSPYGWSETTRAQQAAERAKAGKTEKAA